MRGLTIVAALCWSTAALAGPDACLDLSNQPSMNLCEAQRYAAADKALRDGLHTYDRRHGYRGPEKTIELPEGTDAATAARRIRDIPAQGDLLPAVLRVDRVDLQWWGNHACRRLHTWWLPSGRVL